MNKTLFVYGTLLKHEVYHHDYLSTELLKAKEAWIDGQLYDTGEGYPVCVLEGDGTVYGEIYEVSSETLNKIDKLEEGYEKQEVTVKTDQGSIKAFVYTMFAKDVEHFSLIKSGNWKEHLLFQQQPEFIHYYAYGSCMDDARFQLAKVDHFFKEIVGGGILDRFTTRFTLVRPDGSRADMVEDGGETEGVLYNVPFAAAHYLYKREGVFEQTYRPAFVDVKVNGKLYKDCLTFLVIEKSDEIAPPLHYRTEIEKGADLYLSEAFREKIRSHMDSLAKA
ncbi:gamma-glutamylcyclotransferase [Bacillus sp. NPDC077027]|uniref:gamma-glutamylcyclotransferase n=1 Tax=Bacillus sp. NPDC077027 TaxID=3390548 RepID=UPI003CFE2047